MRKTAVRDAGSAPAGEAPAHVRAGAASRTAAARQPRLTLVPKNEVVTPQMGVAPDRTIIGVLALLASTALFPVSDTAAKILTTDLPALEVAWLRYFVFVVMIVPVLLLRGRAVLVTARPRLQIGRAFASALSTVMAILSFRFLPVAESTAITFVAPVVVTAMAAFFLREKVGLRRWAAAVVGLAGVGIVVQPGTSAFALASLIPLCGSVASATSTVATRMAKSELPETTMVYSAVIGFVVLSALVLFDWHTPSWPQLAVSGIVGFFATLASLMQIYAYRNASASLLAPFSYTQLIWATLCGFLVFGSVPGPAMLCGAAVIAGSGIYTAWRERIRSGTSSDLA